MFQQQILKIQYLLVSYKVKTQYVQISDLL